MMNLLIPKLNHCITFAEEKLLEIKDLPKESSKYQIGNLKYPFEIEKCKSGIAFMQELEKIDDL